MSNILKDLREFAYYDIITIIGVCMNKNLKISFALFIAISAIGMAWNTLSHYFGGVGVSFVCMLVALGLILHFIITDKYVKSRIMDLFVVSCILVAHELIVFIFTEFGWITNVNVVKGLVFFQSILSLVALFVLVYTMFRFYSESKGMRVNFVESMLGGNTREKKEKKSKELINGALEEKPNAKTNEENEQYTDIVIDETEEK